MILSVTPAPALDSTVHLDVMELGESRRIDPPAVRAGGKGLNVARVLSAQGFAVRSLATRGGAAGDRLAADLGSTRVDGRWVPVAAPTRTSTAWVEASGRTTVLNERSGALTEAEWEAWHAALADSLDGVLAATVSGSWPEGAAPEHLTRAVATLKAAGIYTIVDTSGPLLLVAAAAGADLLKPNLEELLGATGAAGAAAGLERLFSLGAGSVLLSRGEDGMSHHTPRDRAGLHGRLDAVLTGNPTGAGDAGVAGWLGVVTRALEDAEDLGSPEVRRRCLVTAVAWSASAVQAPLAGELGPDATAFLDRVRVS